MSKQELTKRYIIFTLALFVSALGVSIITRSNLGTSPISSIPFVLSLNTPLSMGAFIFILNMFLMAGQMMMLGKAGIRTRKMDLLMQIPVSVLFGLFIDICMVLMSGLIPAHYLLRIVSLIVGCLVLATGICLEVAADVTMLSGEYFVQIASKRFQKEFGSVKISFDVSLVAIAAAFSLCLAGRIDGLREGTIIAALLTGPFVRIIRPYVSFAEHWAKRVAHETLSELITNSANDFPVITIAREYGSGGHYVGQELAKRLGIKFYDNQLIELVAQESGLSEQLISEKEQHMPSSLLYQMIMQDYAAPLEKSLSVDDALFVAQSRVIRKLAKERPCVIVGRCADYILRENQKAIHLFIHADMAHKNQRAIKEYGLSPSTAANEVARINKARETHYNHFTGNNWGDSRNYHISFDTSVISVEQICNIVASLYTRK